MTRTEVALVVSISSLLMVLAVFCESPAWMIRLFGRLVTWLEDVTEPWTYHGVHRAGEVRKRPAAPATPTGFAFLTIVPDVEPLTFDWRGSLDPTRFDAGTIPPEQLGGLSA